MKSKSFIGRQKELNLLESLYLSKKFEMLILHGRRRVGKSYLLSHFANLHSKNVVYFTGDKSSEKNNVKNSKSYTLKKTIKNAPKSLDISSNNLGAVKFSST